MSKQYLTNHYKILGKIVNYFESKSILDNPQPPKLGVSYSFLQDLNKYSDRTYTNWVGLFKGINGGRYVVKFLKYRFHNLKYLQLCHEALVTDMLVELSPRLPDGYTIIFPRTVDFIEKEHELVIIRKYYKGEELKKSSKEEQINILSTSIRYLKSLTIDNYAILNRFPILKSHLFPITFPYQLFKAIYKDVENLRSYVKLTFNFYYHYINSRFHSPTYCFAHRDLHENNLLISGKNVYIFDFEVSTIAEEETDLSIAARYHHSALGDLYTASLIKNNLTSVKNISQFIYLTIFYSIQVISSESKEDKYAIGAKSYNHFLLTTLLPAIQNSELSGIENHNFV